MVVADVPAGFEDYRGCGKVWVAVDDDGNIAGIRYKNAMEFDNSVLPEWVLAVESASGGTDHRMLPTAVSPRCFAKIREAVMRCEQYPKRSNGRSYKPSDMLRIARSLMDTEQKKQFKQYRQRCIDELSLRGRVASGMASCYQVMLISWVDEDGRGMQAQGESTENERTGR